MSQVPRRAVLNCYQERKHPNDSNEKRFLKGLSWGAINVERQQQIDIN